MKSVLPSTKQLIPPSCLLLKLYLSQSSMNDTNIHPVVLTKFYLIIFPHMLHLIMSFLPSKKCILNLISIVKMVQVPITSFLATATTLSPKLE